MRLRYMIDMVLRDGEAQGKGKGEGDGQGVDEAQGKDRAPGYEPVGVWVQGPGPGLDIEMFYPDGRDPKVLARKEEADWVVNRLVEAGVANLPDDFLEYHRRTRSPYDGAFSEIVETERFSGAGSCAASVLDTILKKNRSPIRQFSNSSGM